MDPIRAGMTISILRWEEAGRPKSNVVYLSDYRRLRWLRTYTRPMPTPPRAA